MTKTELKQKLIDIRNGAFITPILEEIWESLDKKTYIWTAVASPEADKILEKLSKKKWWQIWKR